MLSWLTDLGDIVSSLGSFFLGLGILGALVAYVLGVIAENRRRNRELRGLLRLLDLEVEWHREQLDEWEEKPSAIIRRPLRSLSTESWNRVQERLSVLLTTEAQFVDISKYYNNLGVADRTRLDSALSEKVRRDEIYDLLPNLRELSDIVLAHIRNYIPVRTRDAGSDLTTSPTGGSMPRRSQPKEQKPIVIEGENWRPGKDTERVLVIEQHPRAPTKDLLARPLSIDYYEDLSLGPGWSVVSHTYDVQANGTAVATYVLEKEQLQDKPPNNGP